MRFRLLATATALAAIVSSLMLVPTRAAVASPDPLATPDRGTCTADYQLVLVWPGGFQVEVTVTAGETPINGWQVLWTYTYGESIAFHWNATITARGPNISAVNTGWNGQLDAGESTSFGLLGEWDARTGTYHPECVVRS
jgi:hypothetical protein